LYSIPDTVRHDAILGDYFTAHPGTNISGRTQFDECVYLGTGCKVIQGLHITSNVTIGAGATVIRDITEAGTYAGTPQKRIKMKIVIIANFTGDYSATDNGRFLYIAKELSRESDVEIVTSNFLHSKKAHRDNMATELPFKVTFLKEPGYKKNVCLKRFYSHYVWGKNVEKYLKKIDKPDVVYCAVPSLTVALKAAEFCKKNSIRFIIDVQDLWPEAFQMVFNIPVVSNIIFAPFRYIANKIYSAADAVVAVSKTYLQRALSVNKKCKDGICVFLGTDLKDFDKNVANNPVSKPEGEIWLGYCGTLGSSYDLTTVFDALALLRDRGENVPKFIILGDGPRRSEFEQYAKSKELAVEFTGRLSYDRMCGLLCACDMVVNPITRGAAQSIINKHADYAASGLPVLNTQECEEYRELVDEYKMGFNCVNSSAFELADNMRILLQDVHLRKEMGINARKCANDKFNRMNRYEEIINIIL